MAGCSGFDESYDVPAVEYNGRRIGDKVEWPGGDVPMKRATGALVVVAALGGCMSVETGPGIPGPIGPSRPGGCGCATPAMIPGVQGPYGEGVPVAGPYTAPRTAAQAAWMMSHSVPLDSVQMVGGRPGFPSGIMQASANVPGGPMPGLAMPPGGLLTPPNMGAVPPLPPGMGGPPMPPGMGGPGGMPFGPGGPMMASAGPIPPPGAMPPGAPHRFHVGRTQVRFLRPSGMKISWFSVGPDGKPSFSTTPIETPGRYNFAQAAIYRLKLSNIEGRPGLDVYPTLDVVPTNPKTEAFLAHSAVPVEFTNEDFQQIAEGNYLVKVIYLPDPQFQELAATGTEEIVSTRLEPGADPIKEAMRRGSILLVIRMGNMDQEAPNTPPIDAPPPGGAPHVPMMPPGQPMMPPPGMMAPGMMQHPMMGPGSPGPGPMVPFTGTGPMGPFSAPANPTAAPKGPAGVMAPAPGLMAPVAVQPTGLPGQPVVSPVGGASQPTGMTPTAPALPAPGTPLSKREDASPIRQVSAAVPASADRPAQPSTPAAVAQPPNLLPTPASLLAIQDVPASKR
jgi:hypothetical protein